MLSIILKLKPPVATVHHSQPSVSFHPESYTFDCSGMRSPLNSQRHRDYVNLSQTPELLHIHTSRTDSITPPLRDPTMLGQYFLWAFIDLSSNSGSMQFSLLHLCILNNPDKVRALTASPHSAAVRYQRLLTHPGRFDHWFMT